MRYILRWAGILSLLLLALNPAVAQETETISIVGSGIVNQLVEALVEYPGHEKLKIKTVGTASGIDRFCNGDTDIVTAVRPMTSAEQAICGANNVAYSEFVVAHHILAFIAHPEAPGACLSHSQLEAALKPSASNIVGDWSFYDEESIDLPLTLLLPQDYRIGYLILDSLIAGDGMRTDVTGYEESETAIAAVGDTAGALGVVEWLPALQSNSSVALLEIDAEGNGACFSPSVDHVEAGSYKAALSYYFIVNRERLNQNEHLADFMRFITDAANASIIASAGLTPPSEAVYQLNARVLADEEAAVDRSSAYQTPENLSGSLTIVGAANAIDVLDHVANLLTQDNAGFEIALNLVGRAAGLQSLCAGEADIALLDADLSEAELAACGEGDIPTTAAKLGAQATVLLGNAADEFSHCLTTDQINRVWRADQAESISEWSSIDPAFPETNMTLFGLSLLDHVSDVLLQTADLPIPPIRRDTEKDFNPLYRAAAVGNVPGALTYMSWHEYQRVVDNDQANIQLVAVDAGAGCVMPSPATIDDGSYVLSRPATLLIRQQALSGDNTRSFLWTLFNAGNWDSVEREGFLGVSALELPQIQRELLRAFAEAETMYPAEEEGDDAAGAGDAPEEETSDADSG
jgi:phosphate transport system substrate-binding protein